MGIFKAYDIRGVYPSELNEEIAYKIGRAFVSFLHCKEVVVGRDARSCSPQLFEALADGITDEGSDMIDIGSFKNLESLKTNFIEIMNFSSIKSLSNWIIYFI